MGHWKHECPSRNGADNRSYFTCKRKGHVRRECSHRVAAAGPRSDVVKGKDRAVHGPEKRRMGPNERGWLKAKETLFDDERVWKMMKEIEKAVGPSGARS